MVRNPYFQVWSPSAQPDGYVDRIEWTFGVAPQAQIDAVAAGDADLAFDAALGHSKNLRAVRGAGPYLSGRQTLFIVLNTESPPFDNLDVRRAMNLAMDRERVVEILGGGALLPTCQQLPPNFPGYEPYCPYTMDPGPEGKGLWTAPAIGVEEAERSSAVRARPGCASCSSTTPIWPQEGASGRVPGRSARRARIPREREARPVEDFYDPGNEFQMALAHGAPTTRPPRTSSTFFTCGRLPPLSGFCDPADRCDDRARARMQLDDPVASGALWAEIDRAIVDQAPYLWLMNPNIVEFVSERVGNYQCSLQWGVLLNQLWVQ